MTALYKPTLEDDLTFYQWAKKKFRRIGKSLPAFNGEIDQNFYIECLGELQGWKCYLCQGKTCGFVGRNHRWIREHKNRNPRDFNPLNLGATSNACNQRKRHAQASGTPGSGRTEREIKNGAVKDSKIEERHDWLNLQRAAPEIQINRRSEIRFREYLFKNVNRKGGLLLKDAIAEGSEFAECNPQTTARYFVKFSSKISPFDTTKVTTEKGKTTQRVILRKLYRPNKQTVLGRFDTKMLAALRRRSGDQA